MVSAVCVVPRGAHPSYAQGYYDRDNRFYQAWDAISRTREGFESWLQRHIRETADFTEFSRVLNEGTEKVKA